jgi:hypothetical protein
MIRAIHYNPGDPGNAAPGSVICASRVFRSPPLSPFLFPPPLLFLRTYRKRSAKNVSTTAAAQLWQIWILSRSERLRRER